MMTLDKEEPDDEEILSILLEQVDGTDSTTQPTTDHPLNDAGVAKLELLREAIHELTQVAQTSHHDSQVSGVLDTHQPHSRNCIRIVAIDCFERLDREVSVLCSSLRICS